MRLADVPGWVFVLVLTLLAAACGGVTGAGARRLLGRSQRPVVVPPPLVEVVTGVLWAVTVLLSACGPVPAWWVPVPLLLATLGVALAAADLATLRLPDTMTLAAYPLFASVLAVAGLVGGHEEMGPHALVGVLLFGGGHLAVRCVSPGALGPGDVKLAGALGAPLGALGPAAAAVCAVVAGTVTAALALASRRRGRGAPRQGLPHGPGLLVGCWLVVSFPGWGAMASP